MPCIEVRVSHRYAAKRDGGFQGQQSICASPTFKSGVREPGRACACDES